MYDVKLTALVLTVSLSMIPLAFMLYVVLLRRAVLTVIAIFREKNALRENGARSLEELGLVPRHFLDPFKPGLRDYKPQALQGLIMEGIIQMTADEKLYLCEEKLQAVMQAAERKKY